MENVQEIEGQSQERGFEGEMKTQGCKEKPRRWGSEYGGGAGRMAWGRKREEDGGRE